MHDPLSASSSHDHHDPRSEFQRALRAIGNAHLVAPYPHAKGKIERRFGTFQKRLFTLLEYVKVDSCERANEIFQMEIKRQNSNRNSSTGEVPSNFFAQSHPHSAIPPPLRLQRSLISISRCEKQKSR
jgi:hypothetical protein